MKIGSIIPLDNRPPDPPRPPTAPKPAVDVLARLAELEKRVAALERERDAREDFEREQRERRGDGT